MAEVVISAVIKAKPGKEQEMEDALRAMIPNVRKEEGTLEYTLHRSQNDPGKFFFYEKYKDKEAFDFHSSTPYFKELFKKLEGLLREAPEVDFYNEVDHI